MRAAFIALLIFLGAFLPGCAHQAEFVSQQLKPGMSREEVQNVLGPPAKVHRVRFQGHEMDYIVWEYPMVPDAPV